MGKTVQILVGLAVAFLGWPHSSWSEENSKVLTLTLQECIRKGIAHSPALEAAECGTNVVEGKLSEAKGAFFLPEAKLRVLGGGVPNVPAGSGPSGNFPSVQTNWSEWGAYLQVRIEAVQPLFTFGKLKNLKKAATRGVHAKKKEERAVRNELVRRIKQAYFGLAYLYSLKDFLHELEDRARKAQNRVSEQLEQRSADVTDIDRMRLEVFLGETDRRLIELQSGIEMGLSAIRILTGISSKTAIDIADKRIRMKKIDLKSVDHYMNRAMANRPEIAMLSSLVDIKKAMLLVSKSGFFPTFFLGGFYRYGMAPGREKMNNPYLNDDFNFHSGGGALGLEQKLGFHLTNARYKQARAEYRQALARKRYAMQGIELELRQAYYTLAAKRDGVASAEKSFRAGRSWVMATTLNYGVGLTPVKDLLEAFLAYSKVKAGYLDIIHEYQTSLAALSQKVGEEVGDLVY